MREKKTAYELSRSQVETPLNIVNCFWNVTHRYRSEIDRVLDLGAGDGRFALGGRFRKYCGIEIDRSRPQNPSLPLTAKIRYGCAFEQKRGAFDACIGNPPYVRHHDLDGSWRDQIADRLSRLTGEDVNRKCNLYVYFLFWALLNTRRDGLVSFLVPYEWVTRPSAKPLRTFIEKNGWAVDSYRFNESIFDGVLTTASIAVIDKRSTNGSWSYHSISQSGKTEVARQASGTNCRVLAHGDRDEIWAMRGMSPGTQKVFTLTEGERIHANLSMDDVFPCVTSLRHVPKTLKTLSTSCFKKRFVDSGEKCWLIRSCCTNISRSLRAYLDSVPEEQRNTWTCTTRDIWYQYPLSDIPALLVSTGFTHFSPKAIINSVGARAIGSVCGVYADRPISTGQLRDFLVEYNFEKRVVSHAKSLKKIEIRQLNTVLSSYMGRCL